MPNMITKRQLLLGGPGLDGYVYHADTYCVSCGQAMIRDLPHEQYHETESRDSEVVPVPIFFGDADRAVHCGDCGEYMYGQDDEGEERVAEEDA